jgi:hypothetical protein
MAGITLATAEAKLELWLAADEAVAKKQSYSIAGRSLTLADVNDIRQNISYWQGWVDRLQASSRGGRVRYGVTE